MSDAVEQKNFIVADWIFNGVIVYKLGFHIGR